MLYQLSYASPNSLVAYAPCKHRPPDAQSCLRRVRRRANFSTASGLEQCPANAFL